MIRRVKKWEIVKATIRPLKELEVGGRRIRFNRNGIAETFDAGLARDIEAKHGWKRTGDVVINEIDYEDPSRERGHVYTFTVPDLPWKRKRKK